MHRIRPFGLYALSSGEADTLYLERRWRSLYIYIRENHSAADDTADTADRFHSKCNLINRDLIDPMDRLCLDARFCTVAPNR